MKPFSVARPRGGGVSQAAPGPLRFLKGREVRGTEQSDLGLRAKRPPSAPRSELGAQTQIPSSAFGSIFKSRQRSILPLSRTHTFAAINKQLPAKSGTGEEKEKKEERRMRSKARVSLLPSAGRLFLVRLDLHLGLQLARKEEKIEFYGVQG